MDYNLFNSLSRNPGALTDEGGRALAAALETMKGLRELQ
jgi:hypothetical protein